MPPIRTYEPHIVLQKVLSKVSAHLIKLIETHAKSEWIGDCQRAFEQLKMLLREAPTLAFADRNCEYALCTDGSEACTGAVLTQHTGQSEQPIHYLSHKLSET